MEAAATNDTIQEVSKSGYACASMEADGSASHALHIGDSIHGILISLISHGVQVPYRDANILRDAGFARFSELLLYLVLAEGSVSQRMSQMREDPETGRLVVNLPIL